jgi:alpha-tubulin suppressor-like RCC1 family protein
MALPLLLACLLAWQTPAPTPHPPLVVAGGYHSFALGSDGRLWGWGLNDSGQLGDGSREDRPVPYLSQPPAGLTLRTLAAGEEHSCILTADGRLYVCGRNDAGQLGTGDTTSTAQWTELKGFDRITQIALGRRHTFALRRDGTVWGWGDNSHGQIDGKGPARILVPTLIPGLKDIREIFSGATHGLAVNTRGELIGWGDGRHGALGPGRLASKVAPGPVASLRGLRQITAGDGFTLALRDDGTVLAWGRNDHGQLGMGTQRDVPKPKTIPGLNHVISLHAGYDHALAQDQSGALWSWGDNNHGQLGNASPSYALVPMPVILPKEVRVNGGWQIVMGAYHTFIVGPGGPILGFGYNLHNQLGDWSGKNQRSAVSPQRTIQ